ncbi:MAG TPA: carboxypeptidase-like regulatory domain-containing protein [Marinilabiliaceae bacterium]|nr:carboxypeptidase-like regulatory domain-containing protein [Marinilabiliaceae bacterium]
MRILSLAVLFLVYGINVRSVIFDNETNEPILFVNICVPRTPIATISNIDVEFTFHPDSSTTISFSSVGYGTQSRQVDLNFVDYEWKIRLKKKNKNLILFKKNRNYDRTTVLSAANKNGKLQKLLQVPDDVFNKEENEKSSFFKVLRVEILSSFRHSRLLPLSILKGFTLFLGIYL